MNKVNLLKHTYVWFESLRNTNPMQFLHHACTAINGETIEQNKDYLCFNEYNYLLCTWCITNIVRL